jgi:hypothetical protein
MEKRVESLQLRIDKGEHSTGSQEAVQYGLRNEVNLLQTLVNELCNKQLTEAKMVNLLSQQDTRIVSTLTRTLKPVQQPARWADVAAEEEETEEGEDPYEQKVSAAPSLAKWMPKPAPFSGSEDVDEMLFTFESTNQPRTGWPQMVLTLLHGQARQAWLALAAPSKQIGTELTWDMFRTCMRSAFAKPDKDFDARMQLRRVRQGTMSVTEYVRHVRSLIGRLAHEPPSHKEQLLALYDGLQHSVKQHALADPRTGQF